MLSHNDLQVGIDANLGIVGIIEAAFFAHDASIGIGKTDLFFIGNGFAWVKLFFALLKGLFGRFDFSQPVLFEFQIFRYFIAGFIFIGLVFVLVTTLSFLNQVSNFSTHSLFSFVIYCSN